MCVYTLLVFVSIVFSDELSSMNNGGEIFFFFLDDEWILEI